MLKFQMSGNESSLWEILHLMDPNFLPPTDPFCGRRFGEKVPITTIDGSICDPLSFVEVWCVREGEQLKILGIREDHSGEPARAILAPGVEPTFKA